jgi:hypothetical protein
MTYTHTTATLSTSEHIHSKYRRNTQSIFHPEVAVILAELAWARLAPEHSSTFTPTQHQHATKSETTRRKKLQTYRTRNSRALHCRTSRTRRPPIHVQPRHRLHNTHRHAPRMVQEAHFQRPCTPQLHHRSTPRPAIMVRPTVLLADPTVRHGQP